jgi:hypothetical protein
MTFRYGFALDRFGPFREMPQYALSVSQASGAKTQNSAGIHRDRVAAVVLTQEGTAEAVMPTGWGKLGANVKAVQKMLGHSSGAMTLDVYSGLFGDDLDGVVERIDSLPGVSKMRHDAQVFQLERVSN